MKGTRSHGERKVFFSLQENLPAHFRGLHGVSLLTRGRRDPDRLYDGEIDFILAHPEFGLLVLEVKGGAIACDLERQLWTSSNNEGEYEIKNPYEQAKRNTYALIEELHASKLAKNFSFPVGYAVWFPDIEIAKARLGLSTNLRDITLDATSLRNPEQELRRIFRECLVRPAPQAPSSAGLRELVRHFVPSWNIPIRLRTALHEEERTLIEATRSQHKVLSMLGRKKRALICGSAGSGKTFLALEKARQLAEQGKEVLILCFNARLAEWLRSVTSNWSGIDVFHYHAFCKHLCTLGGVPTPQPDPHGDREAFYRYDLPEAMFQALETVTRRYDAILVDEAQDFDTVWWIGIEQLLRDPDDSLFYLFFDDNQVIYGSNLEFPIREAPLLLCENCRNTQAIFNGFMEFYRGDAAPEPVGPAGRNLEILDHSCEGDELNGVTQSLRRLIEVDGIEPTEITILTPRIEGKSKWKEGHRIGGKAFLSWNQSSHPGAICCSSIHSFKGLENSVVVVTETSHCQESKRRELMYVAYSRAKGHLIVSRVSARLPRNE